MKKSLHLLAALLFASLPFQASATEPEEDKSSKEIENTAVVPSGTYTVTAHRVDAKQKEIYVKMEDGKILELYLQDKTKVTRNGQKVSFDALKKGQKLEVQVNRKGEKLEPVAVSIKGGDA